MAFCARSRVGGRSPARSAADSRSLSRRAQRHATAGVPPGCTSTNSSALARPGGGLSTEESERRFPVHNGSGCSLVHAVPVRFPPRACRRTWCSVGRLLISNLSAPTFFNQPRVSFLDGDWWETIDETDVSWERRCLWKWWAVQHLHVGRDRHDSLPHRLWSFVADCDEADGHHAQQHRDNSRQSPPRRPLRRLRSGSERRNQPIRRSTTKPQCPLSVRRDRVAARGKIRLLSSC